MEKIAIVSTAASPRTRYLKDVLAGQCKILECHGFDDAMGTLKSSFYDIATVIIDNPSANPAKVKELTSYVSARNSHIFSLPIIILTDPENMVGDDEFIQPPVVAIISTADSEKTVLSRIKNAKQFSNSTTFETFADMLKVLPSLIYLKDKEGRYAFCSRHWHHVVVDNALIRGKTDFDIRKDKENARIARETDLEIIKTGVGKNYIIKEEDDEGIDYLQIIKEPLKNEKGEVNGIIAIINNVTDEEILRQELRKKSITDQLTGLYNRVYFDELVRTKAGKLQFPVTFVSADCDGLKEINDQYGHAAGDTYIRFARSALKKSLPKRALLFRMGGDEFLAVIPNTNATQAEAIVNRIQKVSQTFQNKIFKLQLSSGSYTMNDPKGNVEAAVAYSDQAMYKAKNERKRKECSKK